MGDPAARLPPPCLSVALIASILLFAHHPTHASDATTVISNPSPTPSAEPSFLRANGTQFVANGKTFYFSGFNAYWLMFVGADPSGSGRDKVSSALRDAAAHGMRVARTWAFSDGERYGGLQVAPGQYDENVFRALDFAVAEARRNGLYLIMSLVNNYEDFGGRKQYVRWAREIGGRNVTDDDDFYVDPVVKAYYKNHVKAVLTRTNTITGIMYKDDPTIAAWELINEPRCQADLTGQILQAWIAEMATYLKSIDSNHMLEVGLEGFYGETLPGRKEMNPGKGMFGTDFIMNSQIPEIDFTTIHAYPELWFPGLDFAGQLNFLHLWMQAHSNDSADVLKKPLVLGEFGKSSKSSGYNITQRDTFFRLAYTTIYDSATSGGAFAGGLFWQLLAQGIDNLRDGYEVVLGESQSTAAIIMQESRRMIGLGGH